MSNLNTHGVTDFESAKRFLGDKSQRVLCFATTLTHEAASPIEPGGNVSEDGTAITKITVRHHGSSIIRYYSDGRIMIRNAGWLSATTTDRLHRMTPNSVRVSRAKGGSVESPLFTADYQPSHFERVI